MGDAKFGGRVDGFTSGDEVDDAEVGGFCGRRMRNSDEVDECVGGADEVLVGVGVEGVAGNDFASAGQVALRGRTHQASNMMAALQERGNQGTAEVAGSARDKDAARVSAPGQ